jgi:hypothetical protein
MIDDIDDDELMLCGESDDYIKGRSSLTKKKSSMGY